MTMVLELVAVCVHIGQMRFDERIGMDMSYIQGMHGETRFYHLSESIDNVHEAIVAEAERVAKLLQVNAAQLVDAITQPTLKIGETSVRRSQNLVKVLEN
jgi:hypothetical protein